MGLTAFIRRFVDGFAGKGFEDREIALGELYKLEADLYYRKLAFQSAIALIQNALIRCEFRTYEKEVETKGEEWYLWNTEPNINQNSGEFLKLLVEKLYTNNECLMVDVQGQLLIADSWEKKSFAVYKDVFEQVTVKGFRFDKPFFMDEVLYFSLGEKNVKKLIDGAYESYSKLITFSMDIYQRSRGKKGILKVSTQARNNPKFQADFGNLMQVRFKKFFESTDAVLPIFEGFEYQDLGSKTYTNENTRDVKSLIDDIYDFTARAFTIPPSLLKGDVADTSKSTEDFLSFCMDPLVDLIKAEINRKRYGYGRMREGTCLDIYTKSILHTDIFRMAKEVDKLIASGVMSIDDVRRKMGEPQLGKAWAKKHYITKNYGDIENANTLGGEEDKK